MSLLLRNALMASMEEIKDDLEIDETFPADSLPAALDEVAESEGEYQEAEAVIGELETAAASTEALATALESHIAEGGMTTQTALTHRVALENIMRRLPLDASEYTVATESFGGSYDRLTASMEALDKVKEVLSKIWTGLKNAFWKAIEAVKNFFATIGKSGKAIQAAGQILKRKAEGLRNAKAKGDKMDATRFAKQLHVGGKFDGTVSKDMEDVAKTGNDVGAQAQKYATAIAEMKASVASGNYADVISKAELPEGTTKEDLAEVLGGKKLGRDHAKNMVIVKSNAAAPAKAEIDVPPVAEVIKLGAEISRVGVMLQDFDRKHYKTIEKEISALIKAGDSIANKADEKDSADAKKAMEAIRTIANRVRGFGASYCSYAATVAKNGVGYGNAVLKQYGAKDEAPAGEPKQLAGPAAA